MKSRLCPLCFDRHIPFHPLHRPSVCRNSKLFQPCRPCLLRQIPHRRNLFAIRRLYIPPKIRSVYWTLSRPLLLSRHQPIESGLHPYPKPCPLFPTLFLTFSGTVRSHFAAQRPSKQLSQKYNNMLHSHFAYVFNVPVLPGQCTIAVFHLKNHLHVVFRRIAFITQ